MMKTLFDELNDLERGVILQGLEIAVDMAWDTAEDDEGMEWVKKNIAQLVLIYRRHGGTLNKDMCVKLNELGPFHFRDCFRDYSRIDDGVVMVQVPGMEAESVNVMLGKEIVTGGVTVVGPDDGIGGKDLFMYDLVDKAIVREECLDQGEYCNRSLRVMIEQYNEGRRNK
jgi:hypothetical protein